MIKKSKIACLSAEQAQGVLTKVETALAIASRPSKKVVVETMASEGLCSASSSGTEATFLKHLQSLNLALPAKFAQVMGVPPTQAGSASVSTLPPVAPLREAQIQSPTAPSQPSAEKPEPSPLEMVAAPPSSSQRSSLPVSPSTTSLVALKGASKVTFAPDGAMVLYPDGAVLRAPNLDVQKLRSSCNLIEFSGSYK